MKILRYLIITISICSVIALFFYFKNKNNNNNNKIKNIGIIQIMEHECLDKSREGFIDGLKELGFKDGENIKIDFQNAQGDQSLCNSIASNFANNYPRKDLILAISTPAALSAKNAIEDSPIIATCVTDFESSGLVKSNTKPDTNVTGVSDMIPVNKQFELIKKLMPNAKKVGILYSSNEVNSKIQAQSASEEAKKLNIETIEYTISNSNEIAQIMNRIGKSVDAIFVPTDNTVVSCMPLVSQIASSNNLPVISSEPASVKNGALATYGIDYYELGKQAAVMAVEVLNNNSYTSNIPVKFVIDNNLKLFINKKVAEKLKIDIPNELVYNAEIIN
jgi:putative ABC transport system substrate-binding protein